MPTPTPFVSRRAASSIPRMTALAVVTAAATILGSATASAGEFPDEWFYSGANRPEALRALEGQPAPEISIESWIGDEVSLEDLKGDVVIVDFWATWCGPCMVAIPKNVALVDEYEDQGLHFIGVHDSNSGWNTADQVVRDKSINYPVGLDRQGETVEAYSLSFWPTYVAIDRKGVVRAAGLTPDRVGDVVKVLLAEDPPAGTGGGGAGTTTSEFPAEWFGDGERPGRLVALEGTEAPAVAATAWAGATESDRQTRGRVVVMHFLAPWSRGSREAMPALTTQAAALKKQGVVVLGVSDHGSDLGEMTRMLSTAVEDADGTGADRAMFAIARDQPPAEDARLPIGVTATAYGVRLWPMSVVVDRAGRIRAAGVLPQHIPDVVGRLMSERLDQPDAADADADTD